MNPAELNRRIQELAEKLKPMPSEGIRIDFRLFTEPEQLVLLKNAELDEKYGGAWTHERIMENKDLILKANHSLVSRMMELFLFVMPRAMMLSELEQWFFKFNFNEFFRRWFECQKNLSKWLDKEREEFLRDIGNTPKRTKNDGTALLDGEEIID